MYKKFVILLGAIIHVAYCDVVPLKRYYRPVPISVAHGNGFIAHGNNAVVGQFPWQVAIEARRTGYAGLCGGSLISSNAVLTAAHCCDNFTTFTIQLGNIYLNAPLVTRTVDKSKVVIHPRFSSDTMNFDAAIIKLDQDVPFSSAIRPIGLPRLAEAVENQFYDYTITTSGWGDTEMDFSSSQLKYTDMYVIKNNDCKMYFGSVIVDSTLCARGTRSGLNGPCSGDSGGPAVIYRNNDWVLIGIVSFAADGGCGLPLPVGFMNVSFLLNWISVTTGIPITNFM